MKENVPKGFATNLRKARTNVGLTQQELARIARLKRVSLAKLELGTQTPTLPEVLSLASALKVPVQTFLTGKTRPSLSLKGIAYELHHLGVRDYIVTGATVPGAFRRPEQVVVLAIRGRHPEARLVDAIPYVLATHPLQPGILLAFANIHDRRVRVRLAWLADVTLALARQATFPVTLRTQEGLETLIKKVKKPSEPDSLGNPTSTRSGPIWRRWNVTYAGTMETFLQRTIELAALQPDDEE